MAEGARRSPTAPRSSRYIRETAREYGVERPDPLRPPRGAAPSGRPPRPLDGRGASAATRRDACGSPAASCSACTGYYRYDEGYTPHFAGRERFAGRIVHPQHWPEDLDYAGKRVVVIGSGATAVTLVPALAERGAHVTMLQRSPSYVFSLPGQRPDRRRAARRLLAGEPRLPDRALEERAARRRCALPGSAAAAPRFMRRLIRRGVAAGGCPPGYDVDTHFNPTYKPWDQRLCLVPDGDLFKALAAGRASVVTDRIETLHRARHAAAVRRGAAGRRDRHRDRTEPARARRHRALPSTAARSTSRETVAYKGMMFCGVPNFALTLGYTNASWTLKADLVARVRVPAAQPHGRARGRDLHARARPTPRRRPSRSSTSRPATCCARSTRCRGRARARRGGCTRTTSRDVLTAQARPARRRDHLLGSRPARAALASAKRRALACARSRRARRRRRWERRR